MVEHGFAVTLMRSDGKVYVLVNDDNSIAASKSVDEVIKGFEDRYNRKHAISYEGSMSACINYIFFQPAAVWYENLDALRASLFAGVRDEDIRVYSVRNVSGGFRGLLCGPGSEAVWEAARKPGLITEDFDRIKQEVTANHR